MLYRFIGQYTGGRTSITTDGIRFEGREPSDVPDGSRICSNIEFEAVGDAPKPRRGRPKKGAE